MIVNKVICPEDVLRVILVAEQIPDRATVSRPKYGSHLTYVFRRDLTILAPAVSANKSFNLRGYFLIDADADGEVLQVEATDQLAWHVTAEDLVEALKRSWTVEDEP